MAVTSGVGATWSDIIASEKPASSARVTHERRLAGVVPGPKLGTLTPSLITIAPPTS
jgi:hypothetical protein